MRNICRPAIHFSNYLHMGKRILIVDDEESLCEILQFNLEREGYETDTANSAEQAMKMNLKEYSLIILDVMMGAMSGFQMARYLKKDPETSGIPIIFCTARDNENDTVEGLELGADDYITKPFSIREVLARVKTVLRRSCPETETLCFNTLKIDMHKMQCLIDGKEISLSRKEMELLILLLKNRGRVMAREEILRKVWSDDCSVLDRTIDVNITRLRKKIEPYGQYIKNRQGYGYGFEI